MPTNRTQAELQIRDPNWNPTVTDLINFIGSLEGLTGESRQGIHLLYSGMMPDGVTETGDQVARLKTQPGVRSISDSDVGYILQHQHFLDKLDDAIEREVRAGSTAPLTTADEAEIARRTRLLLVGKDMSGNRIDTGSLWDIASQKYVETASGKFMVLAPKPLNELSVFVTSELPGLLSNPAITEINGLPREQFTLLRDWRGLDAVKALITSTSLDQIHYSGLSGGLPIDQAVYNYVRWTDDAAQGLHANKDLARSYVVYMASLSPAERQVLIAGGEALGSLIEAAPANAGFLRKLGLYAMPLTFLLACSQASAAQEAGQTEQAQQILIDWAVENIGGLAFEFALTGLVALGAGAAVAVGAIPATVAAVVVGGVALVGGFFGGDGAMAFYRLLQDSDENGKTDIFDKLSNLLGGATTVTGPTHPADLNGNRLTIDANLTREEIIAHARDDIAWRYALRELNPFVISDVSYSAHNTDGSLDLHNEATGTGSMTRQYIADRATMLYWKLQWDKVSSLDDNDVSNGRLTHKPYTEDWDTNSVQGNWDYVEMSDTIAGGGSLTLAIDGAGLSLHDHQIVFGTAGSDVINGEGDEDHLYGMAGNDRLNGRDGNDYLEGGAGNDTLDGGAGADEMIGGQGDDSMEGGRGPDTMVGGLGRDTYSLRPNWGMDTIEDSDGQGTINVEGLGDINGEGARKVGDNIWQTDDKRINYTLVEVDENRSDLYVTFSDRTDVICIRNWSPNELGIELPQEQQEEEEEEPTLVGDQAKHTNGSFYLLDADGYVTEGAEANARDILRGTDEGDTIAGLGGNDGLAGRSGDDHLQGGTGDDLIFGGTGADTLEGGEGSDFIFGSAVGEINRPNRTDFVMPEVLSDEEEIARGFSWIAARHQTPRNDGTTHVMRYVGIYGADQRPLFVGEGGDLYVEGDGNVIDGGEGDDYIAAGTGDDTVNGGADDDDIVGMRGDDILFGDDGDDYIWGDSDHDPDGIENQDPETDGYDLLVGGAGNDVLVGQGADDELYGGDGNDFLSGDAHDDDTPSDYHGDDYLDGGAGNDSMSGGGGEDVLAGGLGNDSLWGDGDTGEEVAETRHGADELQGDEGDDQIHGGGGDDFIEGGADNDSLWGDDDGQDTLEAAIHGQDYLDGGDGADYIEGGGNDDALFGGAGDDSIHGDADVDRASSINGDDLLDGEAGNDSLFGGAGNDSLFGGTGNDTLQGDFGSDAGAAASLAGNDLLDGEEGDDGVVGNGGDDTLLGGQGDDTLLGDGTDSGEEDESDGNDLLDGGDGNDALFGQGGDDTLMGGVGSDSLAGGAGEDQLVGEDGNDTLFGQADDDQIDAGDGDDYLDGGAGSDDLRGGEGADMLYGSDGSDVLDGGGGMDTLDGGEGADVLRAGGGEFNHLIGRGGNDQLLGSEGHDQLLGGSGDDTLDGGGGADYMSGGEGNDTLLSSGGDYLEGGAGDDTYIINASQPQLINGEMTYVVPTINDDEGLNTIIMNGVAVDEASMRIYSQGGTTYLSFGGRGGVAIGPDVNLGALRIQGAEGALHSLQNAAGVDPETGRIESAIWFEGVGFRSTASVQSAQLIQGSNAAENLLGGAGDDRVSGADGADLLTGNAGDDELIGGAGSDTLIGGAGADTYRGGNANGADSAADVFRFSTGDGADWIEAVPAAGAPRDVIEFGPGITLEDLEVSNLLQGISDTEVQIVINYGGNDSITLSPGAEGSIQEVRFSDGTTVAMAALLNLIPPRAVDPTRLTGTTSDDVLSGTQGDDRLAGGYGNDTLTGNGGRDWLVGGAGTNRYRFDDTSGNDLIGYTNGEVGNLEFAGVNLESVTARLDGNDLVIAYGSGNFVRISDYSFAPQLATSWTAQFDSLAPLTLGQLLQSRPATQTTDLASRQQQFLSQQLWQLGSTAQRHAPFGSNGPSGVVPNAVQQVDRTVESGQPYEFSNYLEAVNSVTSVTRRVSNPVYENQPVFGGFGGSSGGGGPGTFTPVNDDGYVELPPGAIPVYNFDQNGGTTGGSAGSSGSLVGFFTPSGPGSPSSAPGDQVVGWQSYTYTYNVVTANDTAVQTRLTGTAGNDVVIPGEQTSEYPVLFRGSVDTGDGNDFIYLGSGQNGVFAGPLSRYEDWQRLPAANYFFPVSAFLNRGLGAWVDAGAGNDVVAGTDGNDFIIGGAGNDLLDGQAGADTYHVGVNGNDVDRIADLAEYDWASNSEAMFLAYGGDVRNPNRDIVEFDSSVSIHQLSYRWRVASNEGPGYAMLEFLHQGQLFLQIDYRASTMQGSGQSHISDAQLLQYLRELTGLSANEIQQRELSVSGVELFKFSDGTVLKVADLLAQLPRLPDDVSALPPTVSSPLQDLSANEDEPLSTWLSGGFSDPQGQTLTFSAHLLNGEALPAWMHFDASTGHLSGTPGNAQVGNWEVVVTATNEAGQSTSDSLTLAVLNVNDAPELVGAPTDPIVIDAGTAFARTVDWFQDIDVGDTLTLSAALPNGDSLPGWIQFDANTRGLSASPPAGSSGSTTIRITGTDSSGLTVTSDVVFDVQVVVPPGELLVGGSGSDSLQGGAGDDTLRANAGEDTLDGGAGADHLFAGGESDNTFLFGRGDGRDRVHFDGFTGGHTNTLQFKAGVTPSDVILRRVQDTDLGDTYGALEVSIAGATDAISFNVFFFNGTAENEFNTLHQIRFADGTTWNLDEIVERAFTGGGGNDTLHGLPGADVMNGGAGNDLLQGWSGNDTLLGGAGDDTLRGEGGDDTLDGGAGSDHLHAGGESNNTFLFGRGDGQDRVQFDGFTGGNTNTLQFKAGVNPSEVVLRRVQDTDLGDTYGALEVAIAGTTDAISFNVFFFNGTAENEFNTLHQIRFADGTTWDLDEIVERAFTGRDGNDTIHGLPGADLIDGDNGHDLLLGWSGNDTLQGGAGDDTLRGESGDDTLDGGAGNDHLYAGSESNNSVMFGRGDGHDRVHFDGFTGGNTNTLQFKAGVSPSDVILRRVQDTDLGDTYGALEVSIAGTADAISFNTFFFDGLVQNPYNTLHQIRFADGTTWDLATIAARTFIGTAGDDHLVGLQGAETFNGGAGNDTMLGGEGADTYLFSRGDGDDVIEDHHVTSSGAIDRLQFGAGISQQDLNFTHVDGDLEIAVQGTSDRVTVRNWFAGNEYHIEELVFADGTTMSDSQVQGLISAMAGFSSTSASTADANSRVSRGTVIETLAPNSLV